MYAEVERVSDNNSNNSEGAAARQYDEWRSRVIIVHSNTLVFEHDYSTGVTTIDPLVAGCIPGNLSAFSFEDPTPLKVVVYRPDWPAFQNFFRRSLQENETDASFNVRFFTTRRAYEWYHACISVFKDENGARRNAIMTLNNINEEVVSKKELEFRIKCDPLTKMPNRETFETDTLEMLKLRADEKFVIIRVDIERFHMVNYLFGTEEGDKLLKFVAVRIQEAAESDDCATYCRIGGDQYALCLPYDQDTVEGVLGSLQESVRGYSLDYDIVLSFGLYVVDDPTMSIHTMLARALQAQRTIKGKYANHCAYYDTALLRKESDEHFIIDNMERALVNNEFVVYLQPRVNMQTRALEGAEALVRWRHPGRELIQPGTFIPIFERNGFVMKVDAFVWEECCKLLRRRLDAHQTVMPISANVSRMDLYNPHLPSTILKLVEKYCIPHNLIEFELTESAFTSDLMLLTNLTQELRRRGFTILMDDFGSGYSSLNALKDIDVNVLKLDIRFLSLNSHSEKGINILRHTVEMAKSIGLSVVAEGVETEGQRATLLEIGCEHAQGYLFSKPLSLEDFERGWLDALK